MTLKPNSYYIKWSFSIGYFKKYVNFKSDYLELLLSVYVVILTFARRQSVAPPVAMTVHPLLPHQIMALGTHEAGYFSIFLHADVPVIRGRGFRAAIR